MQKSAKTNFTKIARFNRKILYPNLRTMFPFRKHVPEKIRDENPSIFSSPRATDFLRL